MSSDYNYRKITKLITNYIVQLQVKFSLVPRLSPRANEKSKERGEPGRIYHVRNVIGRENLITCGRTNELAHAVRTEYSCDSFMADRMGLDGHYATLPGSTESYSLTSINYVRGLIDDPPTLN